MASPIRALEIATAAAYRFRIRLDGEFFILRFMYNERGEFWTISISDTSGEPILQGIKVVEGEVLGAPIVDEIMPNGTLTVFDSTESGLDPGRRDLGDKVKILYTPQSEVT